MVYEFDGTKYGKLRDMQAARRVKHPGLVRGGTDFTRAAHAAGAYKRTGKVWRNGRTRPTGRNERPLSDRCRGDMDKPRRVYVQCFLSSLGGIFPQLGLLVFRSVGSVCGPVA